MFHKIKQSIGQLHYISNRVLLFTVCMFILVFLQIIYGFTLSLQEKTAIWPFVVWTLIAVSLEILFVSKIYQPYRISERMLKRFLAGYSMVDYNELGLPVLTPNTMDELHKLDKLFRSPQMFDMNKRQAQYLALQNQINPHFLYNTLESIRSEALIAGLDSVADMTEALATFFRYTISKVENLVSVEEEVENCKTYFRIQQYRFGSRLQLHFEYNEEEWEDILHCRIPKLTLQPILENSIIHGTELKIGTGNLRIQFERSEKRLMIRISDDGVGMDENTLWKLNKRLRKNGASVPYQQSEEKGGIALANVNNRIQLIFGEEYGMHVYSVQGEGTDVEIVLPGVTSDKEIKNRGVLQ
ncbi:MAG: histidine kinase [Lachnospiraceae bacterium]|nr:histidine kinase [Lachnospiraceae bacterium]